MLIDFYLAKGNRLPSMYKILLNSDGTAINLTNSSVTLTVRDFATGTVRINASPVVVTSPANGAVRYDWSSADAALAAGHYYGRFTATYADGRVLSVPNDSWLILYISEGT
jgi:hypothetical protein